MLLLACSLAHADDAGPPPPAAAAPADPPPAVAPAAEPAPAVAPAAAVPAPACEEDQRFLAAMLLLHGDTPADGVAALVAGGDPRGVAVLADVVDVRREGPVVDAAVAGLARYPAGVPVLGAWLGDRALPTSTRSAAVRALGDAQLPEAADALVAAAADPDVAGPLRVELMDTIATRYPDRLPGMKRISEKGGVAWTMVGSATGAGYGLATAGHFGQTQLGGLGALAGAAGGLTGGWFYAKRRPVTAGDAAHVTTAQWAGISGGALLAAGLDRGTGDDTGRALLSGLAGGAVGTTAGILTARAHQGTGRDGLETLFVTGASVATTTTLWNFARPDEDDLATVAGVTTLGAFAGAAAGAPEVDLEGSDAGFVALGTTWGALVGGFVPLGDTRRRGLPVATAGLAGIGAWAASPLYQRPPDELLGGWVGLGAGSAFGSGMVLLTDPVGSAGMGAVLGGTGGIAAGLVLANRDPAGVDGTDLLWGGLGTGWVAWQTMGWMSYTDPLASEGIALTTIGAAASAAAIGSRWAEVPYSSSLTMASTAVWGTYVGAAVAGLADADQLQGALIGGDVGLLAGSLTLVPSIEVAPGVIALGDAGGVVLGGTSTLVAAMLTSDPDVLLATSLAGSGVGMVAGGLLGAQLGGGGSPVSLRLPSVHVPGAWGVAPLAAVADGQDVYGATLTGVGW